MKKAILFLFFFPFLPHLYASESCSPTYPTVTFAGWSGSYADLERGFFVLDGAGCWWTPPSLSLVDSEDQTPRYYETRAIWMADGVIEVSAAFNGLTMDGVDGFVALLNCDLVGSDAWIRPGGGDWVRVRVADCAAPEHEYYHAVYVDSGLELSYELAQHYGAFDHINEFGGVGLYAFEVCLEANPCVGTPINYTEWYLDEVHKELRNR